MNWKGDFRNKKKITQNAAKGHSNRIHKDRIINVEARVRSNIYQSSLRKNKYSDGKVLSNNLRAETDASVNIYIDIHVHTSTVTGNTHYCSFVKLHYPLGKRH